MKQAELFISAGARFDGAYRYRLWRIWNDVAAPRLMTWCMLNPSIADELILDPTVQRQIIRARRLGFDGLEVVNAFGLVSTDPDALYVHDDPIGPDNDAAIIEACERSTLVMLGWGTHGALGDRGAHVAALIRNVAQREPHCLKINADGSPAHPLYLSYTLQPIPFR